MPEMSRSYQQSIKELSKDADRFRSQKKSRRWEYTPVAKHRGPGGKTPGAFLNNATRWPGYGRTSGMGCIVAALSLT